MNSISLMIFVLMFVQMSSVHSSIQSIPIELCLLRAIECMIGPGFHVSKATILMALKRLLAFPMASGLTVRQNVKVCIFFC